jgi:hypothetical protein
MRQRKGTIGIESDKGFLRLRLPRNQVQGSRYIYLNLTDSKKNRQEAERLAKKLEAELPDPFQNFPSPPSQRTSPTTGHRAWGNYSQIIENLRLLP